MESGDYKVLELEKLGGDLKVTTRKLREPNKGEILVKVMSTTINPSDIGFIQGHYGDPKQDLPMIPGFEGSGEVIKVGEGADPNLLGKRVGFTQSPPKSGAFEGQWAQYCYTYPKFLIPYQGEVDYDRACFSIVNPCTVVGFLDTLIRANAKSVIHTGASSALGKMLIRLCKDRGITTINLVRNEKHIKTLIEIGANYVISTSDENWKSELQKISHELNTTVCFDAVGGKLAGQVLSQMPKKSIIYNYGNLEGFNLSEISSKDLIFLGKTLAGWLLSSWVASIPPEDAKKWFEFVAQTIESGSDIFDTKVRKSYTLDQWADAFSDYKNDMSEGKVLFKPNN
jgi:NADPH2:quinone reductase